MKKAIKSMLSTTMIAALAMTAISGCASSTGGQGETQAHSQTEAKTDAGTTAAGDAGEQSKEAQGAVELSGRNKLAFFLPMTGDQMQYGISLKEGAELALDKFNAANGTDFVLEVFDDKGDPKEAVNVANKIISDDSVIAGMGSFSSSCALAAAPVFEENELLLFSPNASHTDFPGLGEMMFSVVMSQKYEGAEFARYLINTYGPQKIAIIYQNTDHGVIASDVFKQEYEKLGGELSVMETFVPGQTKDFSPILSKVKAAAPDVIYASASYNDCAQIFMQANSLNIEAQYVGPGMCLTEEFLNVAGDKLNGMVVLSSIPCFLPSVLEAGNVDDTTKAFVDEYVAKYNNSPDGFAASSYDAVNIVLEAALKVGTDSKALAAELRQLRNYPGVSGYDMSFNENKEMIKGIYAFKVEDGNFKLAQ